jgi:hypothetical protein
MSVVGRTAEAPAAPEIVETTGSVAIVAEGYRLEIRDGEPYALLAGPDGQPWIDLFLGASLDARDGPDESIRLGVPRFVRFADAVRVEVDADSSRWERRRLVLECRTDELRVHAEVDGRGNLLDAVLLGGTLLHGPRGVSGRFRSGARFGAVWTPEPATGQGPVRPASASLALDVLGSSQPGMRHWFATPPPLCLAFSRTTPSPDPYALPPGPWLLAGLLAGPASMAFTGLHYEATGDGFQLRLAYEGHTRVDGAFATPPLVLRPGTPDPYAGLAWYADRLRAEGLAPASAGSVPPPAWWLRPMFCGWGVQAQLALRSGRAIRDECRQGAYDRALEALAAEGLVPGTIVIDDKWQREFGTGEVDEERWPDLRGWIARHHTEGRRVLLWWKAWDAEGLPPALCVRAPDGSAVTVDPSNPGYEARLRAIVRRLVGPEGLDADGLKVDFTATTPSGSSLKHHGPGWGISLLHQLLAILHDEATRTKPEALIVTHAPHPGFADVTGMLRLNDVDPGPPVVPQMEHRARVAAAACPGTPIDTDDWPMVDRAAWRAYQAAKGPLGVPTLYASTHTGFHGEPLEAEDYEALRRLWARAGGPGPSHDGPVAADEAAAP